MSLSIALLVSSLKTRLKSCAADQKRGGVPDGVCRLNVIAVRLGDVREVMSFFCGEATCVEKGEDEAFY